MRSSARRGPGTSSQWKAIAHWQRIDNLLCYCETRKTVNTRNINGMLLCCKEIANQA